MRNSYLFLGSLALLSAFLLMLYGISALPPREREKTEGNDARLTTPLERPTVMFGNPSRGPSNAAVTIVEFGDYQCEPCAALEDTLTVLRSEFPDQVRVVWKDFPNVSVHKDSMNAAVAARCADAQGAFWEYHDLLLANQASINENAWTPLAAQLDLDLDQFQDCVATRRTEAQAKRDFEEGLRLRVDATPYLFINERRMSGAASIEQMRGFVNSALAQLEAEREAAQETPEAVNAP